MDCFLSDDGSLLLQVNIIEWEDRTAYVRSFVGEATETHILYNVKILRNELVNAGLEFDDYYLYYTCYSLRGTYGRYHEVMFIK